MLKLINPRLNRILKPFITNSNTFNRNMCTNINEDLKTIFFKSIQAVHPPTLIKKHVYLKDNKLHVYNKEYKVNKNCYIVGFGKAVYEMSQELEKTLGEHLVRGCVSTPRGTTINPKLQSRVVYHEGAANNLPDIEAEYAAKQISNLVKPLTENDILFVLISGGGSALLPAPLPSIPLTDKLKLTKILANNGASIIELNCVRKKLSTLKGGGLACEAFPATVVTFILSDVIGDPLDFIASGPTVPDTDSLKRAKDIIKKYAKDDELPLSIKEFLQNREITNKLNPPVIEGRYKHVTNFLIGSNVLALKAAESQAKSLGYDTLVLSNAVCGNVNEISKAYGSIAFEYYLNLKKSSTKHKLKHKLMKYQELLKYSEDTVSKLLATLRNEDGKKCLIFGGEPTVQVKGMGKGGRNLHLALLFSSHLDHKVLKYDVSSPAKHISFLSCGTDGLDGPTDAAGAIGFNGLSINCNLDVKDFIKRHDSYNFFTQFQNGKYLIKTGHTGTNVMDVHLILFNIL